MSHEQRFEKRLYIWTCHFFAPLPLPYERARASLSQDVTRGGSGVELPGVFQLSLSQTSQQTADTQTHERTQPRAAELFAGSSARAKFVTV